MFMIDRERMEISIFPTLVEVLFRDFFIWDSELEEILDDITNMIDYSFFDLKISHRVKLERRYLRLKDRIVDLVKSWPDDLKILMILLFASNLEYQGKLTHIDYETVDGDYSDVFEILVDYLKEHKEVLQQLNLAISLVNNFKLEFIKERYYSELS